MTRRGWFRRLVGLAGAVTVGQMLPAAPVASVQADGPISRDVLRHQGWTHPVLNVGDVVHIDGATCILTTTVTSGSVTNMPIMDSHLYTIGYFRTHG